VEFGFKKVAIRKIAEKMDINNRHIGSDSSAATTATTIAAAATMRLRLTRCYPFEFFSYFNFVNNTKCDT